MQEEKNTPLHRIAKSTSFIFAGTLVSLLIGFLTRILLVKITTQKEYGIYALSFTIVTMITTISMLGLQEGVTRHLAHFKSKNNDEVVQNTIFSSIVIALVASIPIAVALFLVSEIISTKIYSFSEMTNVLRIMAVTIPLMVLMNVIVSVYRAMNNTKIKIFLYDVFKPFSYLLFLGIAVILSLSFINIIYLYTLSIILTFILIWQYFIKKPPTFVYWKNMRLNQNTRDLLIYSVPLLAVSILFTIMAWTDTLMLGYFKTAQNVASYNAAYPIAYLLSIVINSIGYIYVPVVSELYSHNKTDELRIVNASATKWCFMTTFPIFMLMVLFPERILSFLYDIRYTDASFVLQILAFGTVLNSYFGLNYYTLLSTGRSSFLLRCSLISALLNVGLNIILIPSYGMVGAAIASAFSFLLIEVYMTITLYKSFKMHSFSISYLRFTFAVILLSLTAISVRDIFMTTFQRSMILYSLFLFFYLLSIYCTKLLDKEDLLILRKTKIKIQGTITLIRNKLAI
jgi:O-antigen/teichoic acid export membrane protein